MRTLRLEPSHDLEPFVPCAVCGAPVTHIDFGVEFTSWSDRRRYRANVAWPCHCVSSLTVVASETVVWVESNRRREDVPA